MQTKTFYAPYQTVTVNVGGVPISVNAEVEITLREPAKQDQQSKDGWEQIKRNGASSVTAQIVPAGTRT